MTIRAAFNAYRMDVIVYGNQSRKTEENHLIVQRNLLDYVGDIDVDQLTFAIVRDWKLHLDKGRSPETVRNYIIKLRVVLAYLKKRGIPALDPDLISVPKRTDKVPSYVLKEDVAKLIECTAKVRNKAIISLLYSSGIRVSELCRLNTADLKKDHFTVIGKGGKARLCFIDTRTQDLITLYLQQRIDNHEALFISHFGRITPGNVQEVFKYARKRANLPNVHPHTMRHSFATNLLEGGMHIYTLSRLLGHTSIATTQAYLHTTDRNLQTDYAKYHTV